MADEKKNPKKGQINIELDEKIAEGTYSNLAIINHSVSEFVVDFVSIMPGTPKSKVKSRIILTPQHAKRLLKALADNVNRFEKELLEYIDLKYADIYKTIRETKVLNDETLEKMRKAIKDSNNDDQIDTVLNRIYDDGFQDGSNESEEE